MSKGIIRRVNLGIEGGIPIDSIVDKECNIVLKKHINTEKEISLEEAVQKVSGNFGFSGIKIRST